MAIERTIYTARAKAMGGRFGTAKSDDGQIDLKLDRPVEMGGKGNGPNLEHLFAAGYAACFIGALRVVARKRSIRIPEDVPSIEREEAGASRASSMPVIQCNPGQYRRHSDRCRKILPDLTPSTGQILLPYVYCKSTCS
jgi:organic hydroperoxide reductase OsmC/OhrA